MITPLELEMLKKRFRVYTDRFRLDGKLQPMHQLKLEHTLRVAADARLLAAGMGWATDEVCLAEAVGLCHDVARFPQYKQYGSFSDSTTVDHGDLGFQTLEDEGLLEGIAAEEYALIRHSVQYHNKKDLYFPVSFWLLHSGSWLLGSY